VGDRYFADARHDVVKSHPGIKWRVCSKRSQ